MYQREPGPEIALRRRHPVVDLCRKVKRLWRLPTGVRLELRSDIANELRLDHHGVDAVVAGTGAHVNRRSGKLFLAQAFLGVVSVLQPRHSEPNPSRVIPALGKEAQKVRIIVGHVELVEASGSVYPELRGQPASDARSGHADVSYAIGKTRPDPRINSGKSQVACLTRSAGCRGCQRRASDSASPSVGGEVEATDAGVCLLLARACWAPAISSWSRMITSSVSRVALTPAPL